jgi:hypothetical protein
MRRPSHRVWLVAAISAAVVAVLWSGLWFLAASTAKATIAGWREREANVGRVYSCANETVSGFPFRIEVHCTDPGVELHRDEPPVALKAADLRVFAQVYQPTLLVTEFTGPMTIAEPGQPPGFVANWTRSETTLRGAPKAPEQASIVFDRPAVDRIGDGGTVLKADRVEISGRMAEGSAAGNPVIPLALHLVAGTAPELHPFTVQPLDADIAATLYGLSNFAPKPWAERFRELQARGGRIEITRARVQQGDAIAVSTGTLGLTARGGLDGQLNVTIVGLEQVVKSLDLDNVATQGQIGSTINALDRLIPGIGQFARQNAAPGILAGLHAMGERTVLEGRPALRLPLRFADGQVLLGPFPVGRMPLMF